MSDFQKSTGTPVSNQKTISGFQFVSPYLLKNLRPTEAILYYAIHHFNLTKNHHCYAKTATLMSLSGIGARRNFSRSIKSLLDKGLIIQRGTNRHGCNIYETLFPDPKSGPAVNKSFLFNPDIGAGEKVINIAVLGYPKITKMEISRKLNFVSKSSVYHARILPKSDVFYSPHGMQNRGGPDCKNIHPNNLKELNNNLNYSTYTNLLGDRVGEPENTDPVVVSELQKNEEMRIKEIKEKEAEMELKKVTFDLFGESTRWNSLLDDLDRIFKTVPDEVKIQTVWETRNRYNTGRITQTTPTGYAIGIIKQYLKMFYGRSFLPTIRRVKEIVQEYEKRQKLVLEKKQKEEKALKEKNEIESRREANLRKFRARPKDEQLVILERFCEIKDPKNYLLSKFSFDEKVLMLCEADDFDNFVNWDKGLVGKILVS